MAQVPATRITTRGDTIDYTPGSAVTAGAVIVLGAIVAIATQDIPANTLGALAIRGHFRFPKIDALAISAGDKLYWDPAGNPVDGDAGSGAITKTAGSLKVAGYAIADAASGEATIDVSLSRV